METNWEQTCLLIVITWHTEYPGARGFFFFLLFAAEIERRSHDRDEREKNSPQTTGKQTLWHPGYVQNRLAYLFKSLRTTNARYGLT